MKTKKKILLILFLALGLIVCLPKVGQAAPMGTAFTYQGRLMDANSPAKGLYDLQFKLYDSPSDGNQLASIIDINELDVLDGYLTVLLDFGSDVFIGNACWLEMGVRPGELNDPNAYTTLSPRQQITPTPYALGYLNPLLGLETAFSSATGNTFYGTGAGASNTTGNYNSFLGYYAGNKNTTGCYNTFSGTYAGYKNNTASWNTFSGYVAGYSNTTGNSNTFSGVKAGYSNTTGNYNTFSGTYAGYFNTTGRRNTFSGACAGYSNTTGNGNVFIGYQAGYYETGSNKLYIANGQPDPNVLIYGDFSTGRVGIGTTTPGYKLDVRNSLSVASGFTQSVTMDFTPSGSSGGVVSAGYFAHNYSGTGGPQLIDAVYGRLGLTGSSTSQYGAAGWFNTYCTGGPFNSAIGVLGTVEGSGTITSAYGGYFQILLGGGISTGYGVYVGSVYGTNKWSFYASDASTPSYFAGYVGIGTKYPQYTLDVIGNIRAQGSVYYGGTAGSNNGTAYNKPDYVFEEGYDIMSVDEVEKYLKKENHLPWMTSAKQEKQENGSAINITRMAFETVETAENLQMQMIELNKIVKEQAALINAQQKRIEALEETAAQSKSLKQRLDILLLYNQ